MVLNTCILLFFLLSALRPFVRNLEHVVLGNFVTSSTVLMEK